MTGDKCKYNPAIDCGGGDCERCGWNPAVTAERIRVLRIRRKLARGERMAKKSKDRSWVWRYREVETVED